MTAASDITYTQRAKIAAQMLKARYAQNTSPHCSARLRQKRASRDMGRAFDACFEMGDGDDVYRELMCLADHDPVLVLAINALGFANWLTQEYRAKHDALPNPLAHKTMTPLFDDPNSGAL